MGFGFLQQSQLLELLDDLPARVEAVQAGVPLGRFFPVDGGIVLEGEHGELPENPGVAVEHIDQRQTVALAQFVVVEIVGRGDLHATGAEVPIHVLVGDDGD